jgi:hypothetical protein
VPLERGGRRLVDDAQHLQARDLARVLGGLALGIVEVGGHRDDRLGHFVAEKGLGGFLHLLQDEGGDLRGAVVLALRLHPGIAVLGLDDLVGDQVLVLLGHRVVGAAADQAFDGEQRVFRIGDALALGRLSYQPLARFGERDHGRRGARALGVLDHFGILALHDRDTGIRRAEIDADYLAHVVPLMQQTFAGSLQRRAPPIGPSFNGPSRLREARRDI